MSPYFRGHPSAQATRREGKKDASRAESAGWRRGNRKFLGGSSKTKRFLRARDWPESRGSIPGDQRQPAKKGGPPFMKESKKNNLGVGIQARDWQGKQVQDYCP